MDKVLVYEYIIGSYRVEELKKQGLTENGIIVFADSIMERYFNAEYLNPDDVRSFNEDRM